MYSALISSVIFICIGVYKVQGILCYECDNMPSQKDCIKYGRVTRCMYNQRSCQTEMRFHKSWPTGMKMTTKCKQRRACVNNFLQNRGTCYPYKESETCYCCCHTNRCNTNVNNCWNDFEGALPSTHSKRISGNRKRKCKRIIHVRGFEKKCTNDNEAESVCTFYSHHPEQFSNFQRKCEEDKKGRMKWKEIPSLPAPGQLRDLPKCSNVTKPRKNQVVTCTDENNLGSNCTYDCTNRTAIPSFLMEFRHVVCDFITGFTDPQWSGIPPICEANFCEDLGYNETDFLESCESKIDNKIGTRCTFSCNVGYMLIPFENSEMECMPALPGTTPQWSKEVPKCRPLSCAGFKVANGKVDCENEFFYNSKCSVKCLPDYVPSPDNFTTTTCKDDLTWSHEPPSCVPFSCPTLEVPNGKLECSNGYFLNSACTVSCMQGYKSSTPDLVHTVCLEPDYTWSREELPTCNLILCPPFVVPNGNVNCTKNRLVGSACEATCLLNTYKLFPKGFISSTCLIDQTWSSDPPCCAKECPPNAPMDMVVVMDSSSSINHINWILMKQFVINLIGHFHVGPDSTNFAVFRYTRRVDTFTEILLSDYSDQETLTQAVRAIPYKGTGTWTGIALGHAASNSLLPSSGNRPGFHDIVLVITDGQTNKKDDALSQAQLLLNKGAIVMVVAVQPERLGGRFTKERLFSIAGNHEERVFLSHCGFKDLGRLYKAIADIVCQDMCKKT